ncbi:hypothetical protein J7L87_00080, partial [bacterium]|nr:hypothetical protein [bacterium]
SRERNGFLIFKKHPVFEEIDLKGKVFVSYLHNVKIKKGEVLIETKSGKPFLLIEKLEKGGKIGCIFGAPYGEGKRKNIFYQWKQWDKLMEKLLLYLVERS